jgi:hypothetical protein
MECGNVDLPNSARDNAFACINTCVRAQIHRHTEERSKLINKLFVCLILGVKALESNL